MPNYENGKIYKMVGGGLTYVGSTTRTLAQRKAMHKSGFKRWKAGNGSKTTSYQLFDSGEPVDIVLLEDVPCERKEQLHARERYWIEKLDCVNMMIPGRSDKEYYQDNKERISEYQKEWYEQNRGKILELHKEYRQQNRERISEHKKKWVDQNKDRILEKEKKRYEQNRDEILERRKQKVPCPVCSKVMRKDSIPRHIRMVHKNDTN